MRCKNETFSFSMEGFTTLDVRSNVDIGLASFVRGIVCWEGDHVR